MNHFYDVFLPAWEEYLDGKRTLDEVPPIPHDEMSEVCAVAESLVESHPRIVSLRPLTLRQRVIEWFLWPRVPRMVTRRGR